MQILKHYELSTLVVEQGKRRLAYNQLLGKLRYYYNNEIKGEEMLYYEQAKKFLRKYMGKDSINKCIKGKRNDFVRRH